MASMQRTTREEGFRAKEDRLKDQLLRGLAGDNAAYRMFLTELSTHLRAFLRKRLFRLPDEVEDLVQESLCLLYTSDAADERSRVDFGGRRIIKKKKMIKKKKKK